jgi:hypothetical protein
MSPYRTAPPVEQRVSRWHPSAEISFVWLVIGLAEVALIVASDRLIGAEIFFAVALCMVTGFGLYEARPGDHGSIFKR